MPVFLMTILTTLFYFIATSMQWITSTRLRLPNKKGMLLFGSMAVVGHALILHHAIDTQMGQNLSVFNMASLAAWLITIFFILLAFRKSIEKLGLILFPLAAILMLLATWWPGEHLVPTANNVHHLLHILLAVVTFSVLAFAGIQALLIALIDRQLHQKLRMNWLNRLPPLETMEALLFQMISMGFALLTILLLSSFYFYSSTFGSLFYSKALVAIISWMVFGVLILGHTIMGWRGKKALYGTGLGFVLVFLLYFGVQQLGLIIGAAV